MAERTHQFPDPGAAPGQYAVDWLVGKHRHFVGDITLAPLRRTTAELHGTLRRPKKTAGGVVYPTPGTRVSLPRLVGRLRSNEDVVLIDVVLQEWFPQRYRGYGHWAIVGLGIADVPDDRYAHVSFQVSETDLWLGAPPIEAVTWPKPGRTQTQTYSATVNRAAHRVWRDTRNGVTIDVGYLRTFSLDRYRFGLTFAPVFDIQSRRPLTLDEWQAEWISPLIDLASIATKRPQTLSWLTVHQGEDRERRSGTVFAWGIHQAPYAAHYDDDWRIDPDRQPLFTLATLKRTPMNLVRTWRKLQAGDDTFVDLYRAALFQPDLPSRARFLHLIQALEARHSFANREADRITQTKFATRREETIAAISQTGLSSRQLKFLKDEWSKYKRDSLERRLRPLLNQLPTDVRTSLEADPRLNPIRSRLRTEHNAHTTEAQLRVLRNQLSHGDRNYPDYELEPWVALVETVCQSQLLTLLGLL